MITILITVLITFLALQLLSLFLYSINKDFLQFNFIVAYGILLLICKPIKATINFLNVFIHGVALAVRSPCKYFIYTRNPFKALVIKRKLHKKTNEDVWYIEWEIYTSSKEVRNMVLTDMKKHKYKSTKVYYL